MADKDFEDIFKRIRILHSGANPIKLRVQRQGESDICYIFDRKTALRKLLEDYCKLENLAYDVVRFLYDGERLPAEKCADDMEMDNGDIIDVFNDQTGGYAYDLHMHSWRRY